MADSKLQPGTLVALEGIRGHFQILEGPNTKGEYLIAHGHMKLWAHDSRIKKAPAPSAKSKRQKKSPSKSISNIPQGAPFKIDLHGVTVTAALEALEKLLDRAVLENSPSVEIIHGIGTGAIKLAVHSYLASYPHLSSFRVDPLNAGTTWAFL